MIKTNYHTHSNFCDGHGAVEDYVKSAVDKGFTALGFSAHAPLPFETGWNLSGEVLPLYMAEIRKQQSGWKKQLQIYLGLEVDYITDFQSPSDAYWHSLGLDYIIGSVHTSMEVFTQPPYLCVDGPLDEVLELVNEYHEGSWQKMIVSYYRCVCGMLEKGGFSFIGHFDLVKKRNGKGKFFSEDTPWYRKAVMEALMSLKTSGIIMEVNTGAISRGIPDTVYPSAWILQKAHKLNIPVMLNADAHHPDSIDCHFDQSFSLLREIGFKEIWALLDGQWQALPL